MNDLLSYRKRSSWAKIFAATSGLVFVTQVCATSAPMLPNAPDRKGETLINRYTALALEPDETIVNPIAVVARVTFPRTLVKTVGDAVKYLLIRTGYELPAESAIDPQVLLLFGKRLPDSHRELGPYRVDTMLNVLMGPSFIFIVDHERRSIVYRPLTGGAQPAVSAIVMPTPLATAGDHGASRSATTPSD